MDHEFSHGHQFVYTGKLTKKMRTVRAESQWKSSGWLVPAPHAVKFEVLKRYSTSKMTWVETGTWMGDTTSALSAMAFPQASTARELLKLQPLKEFAAVVNNVFSKVPGASGQEWSKGRVCCPRHASVKLEQASRYRLGAVFRVCTKGTLERSRRLRTSLRPSLRGSRLSNPRHRIQETRWRRSRLCALSETGVQCWI